MRKIHFFIFIAFFAQSQSVLAVDEDWFALSIIHINDFHARFEEINQQANDCKVGEEECVGGYARVVHKVKELLAIRENPLYLNAGDNFQGTLWYNIGRWNVTNEFLNMLPADAQTIGNHEFDHDIAGVVPFLQNTKTPVVIANVDDSNEESFQGTYNKSIIIDKYGRKIGIIGAILRTTNTIAKTGNLRFYNEAEKVREEAEKLKTQGVNIIIVISHCGLDRDREIARLGGPDIDIIVGGHSHSFLFNGTEYPALDRPAGTYPIVVTQDEGHRVLIVQASAYTKYVGDIKLYFDDDGIIQDWSGNPIYLGSDVPKDVDVEEALKPWRAIVNKEGQRIVGSVKFRVSGSGCYNGDCLMGTLQADAMAFSVFDEKAEDGSWTYATIAITNPGGIRGSLESGELTYSNLVTTTPFENTCDKMEVQGKFIREALEFSARFSSPSILQTSGLKVVFNMTKPAYERVHSLKVLCRLCAVPRYEDIQDETWYRVILNNFLLNNGDNFAMLRENMRNHAVGTVDIDALTNYVEKNSPITMLPPQGRVQFVHPWQDLEDDGGKAGFKRLTSFKNTHRHLKVLLAIGGWNEGSGNYSDLAGDPRRRAKFVKQSSEYIRKHNFDGLDLDWEYPSQRGGSPQDKESFLLLVKELHAEFKRYSLYLSSAFGAAKKIIDSAYNVKALAPYLDSMHIMCYDYFGSWDKKIGLNAPIENDDELNVKYSIDYFIKLGAPAEKIIMGLPFYGRTFITQKDGNLGDESDDHGFAGPFTREDGFMGYNEICSALRNPEWEPLWDVASSEAMARTKVADNETRVVTYDSPRSIANKVRYAIQRGLGGVMVWSIDTDDFQGDCDNSKNFDTFNDYRTKPKVKLNIPKRTEKNYPLLRTLNDAISITLDETMQEINLDKENEIGGSLSHGNQNSGRDPSKASSIMSSFIVVVFLSILQML